MSDYTPRAKNSKEIESEVLIQSVSERIDCFLNIPLGHYSGEEMTSLIRVT